MRKPIVLASLMLVLLTLTALMPVVKALRYHWDGVRFVEGELSPGRYIKYPHPDRDYYGISPYSDWSKEGVKLYHNQIDDAESAVIVKSAVLVCATIGAIIGTRGGPWGAVLGTVVGGLLGLYVTWVSEDVFLDEHDCIWWWVSIDFWDWLSDNAWWLGPLASFPPTVYEAEAAILAAFLLCGYLRVSSVTFYDAVGAGNPRPSGGGGPFCPTLFVWDGSQCVEEALLDIHADSDVTLQHTITETLVPDKNSYKLSLRELDEFTSHIDHVKLYVADSDGEMHETHLTKAVHSLLGDVKEPLLHDDDTRLDLTPEQTIDMEFTLPNIEDVAYFIFEINGYNQKDPGDGPF